MKKRSVYILRTGGLSRIDNQFYFYEIEVFSSMKKIEYEIKKRIEINKGDNIRYDEGYCGRDTLNNTLVTYDCLNIDGDPMTVRYEMLEKTLL